MVQAHADKDGYIGMTESQQCVKSHQPARLLATCDDAEADGGARADGAVVSVVKAVRTVAAEGGERG